jgi:3-hydroxyisobutyrate dehydrogenase-like beta-hydroxyacid dehydrogenase
MDVALIGLGRMGMAYVERLTSMGHDVLGYDISAAAMEMLPGVGGRASSIEQIAASGRVVLVSLPNARVVNLAAQQVLAATTPGAMPGFIDLSTSGPTGATAVAALLASRGVPYAEAPVTGGVSGALSGSLTLMAAGDADLLALCEPVLVALGKVVRLGDVAGQGQTMKVLNNLLSASSLAITSEAMAAGVAVGLDPEQMLEVFNGGSGRNAATMDKFPKYVLSGTFDQGFAASLMAKDVRLAQELFHEEGIPAWVAAAVVETWIGACSRLDDDADFTEIARVHASYIDDSAWTSTSIYER